MKDFGIVVCSRLNSSRVPNKPMVKIHGLPVIEHLIKRLLNTNIKIVVAIPTEDIEHYQFLKDKYQVILETGNDDDPLHRMYVAAKTHSFKHVIRVSHDKILVDHESILDAVNKYLSHSVDYLFSSTITPGAGFEIISFPALETAALKFKKVEHISYAIKCATTNFLDYKAHPTIATQNRFLIDYKEDVELLELIMSVKGPDVTLKEAIQWLESQQWPKTINHLPEVTIYTCMYNASKYLEKCIDSVLMQLDFPKYEYLLVDDASTDTSLMIAAKAANTYQNIKWFRNPENLGLASSSNVALKNARGKYIIRLDADDYFVRRDAIKLLLQTIKERSLDAVYPNNYYGHLAKVQYGKECHHVGGALFRTSAINHIKFTDGLRGLEGYDFFKRAKDVINIGYFNRPIFFYRQHNSSLSKTNLEYREQLKQQIDAQNGDNILS